jgi:hypothetical protein
VHEWQGLVHAARQATWAASAYGITAVRVALRGRAEGRVAATLPREERLAFVVGSPRSGTSFTGTALGSLPGWVDLGEVPLLKAAVPELVDLSPEEQAAAVRRILQRVRTFGLVRGLRGVEWVWHRYVTAAQAVPKRTVELRYEALVADPAAEAHRLSGALDCDPVPLQSAFAEVRDRSVGRWRRDLTPEQLAEVESEAGVLLAELGYT